jgi:hypothetical protein
LIVFEFTDVAVAHAIQLAVAPVFLLSAIGAMLAVMTSRLGRIIDRARDLEARFRCLSGILFNITNRSQNAFAARQAHLLGDRSLNDDGVTRVRGNRIPVRKRILTVRLGGRRPAFHCRHVDSRFRAAVVFTGDLCRYHQPSYRPTLDAGKRALRLNFATRLNPSEFSVKLR